MLMTCEQDIEIQLLTNMISHIFGALGKRAACRKIALEPAVINADGQVGFSPEPLKRAARGLHRPYDPDARQMLGPLPDVYIIRRNSDQAHAQAVFQRMHTGRKPDAAFCIHNVFAQAAARRPDR